MKPATWNLIGLALGIAAATPATAATYTLNLTGVLDDVSVSSFDFGQDTLTFSTLNLTGFTPFTLVDGDVIEYTVTFTGFFLGVPPFDGFVVGPATEGSYGQLFAINFDRIDDVPPVNGSNSGTATLIGATGDLAGINLDGGCSNCFAPIMGRAPGPFGGFSFTGITGSTTVSLDGSYEVDRISFTSQVQTGFEGAVPEPASWAMLIAGFGLTGAAMRRRRLATIAA